MLPKTTTCAGCFLSRARQRTTCFWCGCALPVGRAASPEERYETSPAARQDRIAQIEAARRDPDAIDGLLLQELGRLEPFARFTHAELVRSVGLNPCAVKHALLRLSRRGIVADCGRARIRSNRYRIIWQVLPPTPARTVTRVEENARAG